MSNLSAKILILNPGIRRLTPMTKESRNANGDTRRCFVADVHREENYRFIVRTDEQPPAFFELEAVIRG